MRTRFWDYLYLGAWLALFCTLAAFHSPWRDEYQTWLVSIRTENLKDFFEAIYYERNPPLHYILLRVLNWVWLLFAHEPWPLLPRLVTWTFTFLSVCVLVLGFKVPRWFRYGVPLGVVLLFEHGVISRSYAIGDFFLLFAVFLKQRGYPRAFQVLLLLAASTHFVFSMVAGAFFLLELHGRKIQASSVLVALGFAAVFFFQLPPPSDSQFAQGLLKLPFSFWTPFGILGHALTGFDGLRGMFLWNENPFLGWQAVFPVSLLVLAARRGFPLVKFLAITGVALIFFTVTYAPALRHLGVLYVAALALLLYQLPRKPIPKIFAVFVFCMVFASARWIYWWHPFNGNPGFEMSGSTELVEKIGGQLSDPHALLIADPSYVYFAPMAMLNIPVFDPRRDRMLGYPYFRMSDIKTDFQAWCRGNKAHIQSRFSGKVVYYGVRSGDAPIEACGHVRKIFETSRPIMGRERFAVFKLDSE